MIKVDPKSNVPGVLTKRDNFGNRDWLIHRGEHRDRGSDWDDLSYKSAYQVLLTSTRIYEEAKTEPPQKLQREHCAADTVVWDF